MITFHSWFYSYCIHLTFTTGQILGSVLKKEKNKGGSNQFCVMQEVLGSILFELVLEDMNNASTGMGVGMEY